MGFAGQCTDANQGDGFTIADLKRSPTLYAMVSGSLPARAGRASLARSAVPAAGQS